MFLILYAAANAYVVLIPNAFEDNTLHTKHKEHVRLNMKLHSEGLFS
jgi:hypothetical protein